MQWPQQGQPPSLTARRSAQEGQASRNWHTRAPCTCASRLLLTVKKTFSCQIKQTAAPEVEVTQGLVGGTPAFPGCGSLLPEVLHAEPVNGRLLPGDPQTRTTGLASILRVWLAWR